MRDLWRSASVRFHFSSAARPKSKRTFIALENAESNLKCLMVAACAGDHGAYRKLLADLAAALETDFAADLLQAGVARRTWLQDVLVSLHYNRVTFDARRPFANWVVSIACHRLDKWCSKTGPTIGTTAEAARG